MQSVFSPASPQARAVAHLWWWMVGVGGAVWIGVIIAMLLSVRAKRAARGSDGLVQVSNEAEMGIRRVVAGATFITVLILLGFLAFDFTVGRTLALHPSRALTIEIV